MYRGVKRMEIILRATQHSLTQKATDETILAAKISKINKRKDVFEAVKYVGQQTVPT